MVDPRKLSEKLRMPSLSLCSNSGERPITISANPMVMATTTSCVGMFLFYELVNLCKEAALFKGSVLFVVA